MNKRPFQIMDEMNVYDELNGTKNIGICNQFLSGNMLKGGAQISMGVPQSALVDVMNGKYIPLLILLGKNEYDKKEKEPNPNHVPELHPK